MRTRVHLCVCVCVCVHVSTISFVCVHACVCVSVQKNHSPSSQHLSIVPEILLGVVAPAHNKRASFFFFFFFFFLDRQELKNFPATG